MNRLNRGKLVLVAAGCCLTLAACGKGGQTQSTAPDPVASSLPVTTVEATGTSSSTPVSEQPSATPTSETPSPSVTASATPSASGSATASTTASDTTASDSMAPIALPDEFGGWTKVEGEQEDRWSVAGYSHDQLAIQVRAARTPNDLPTVMRSIVGDKFVKDASGYCGQKGQTSACVRKSGPTTVAIVSKDLESEELSGLLPQLFEQMG